MKRILALTIASGMTFHPAAVTPVFAQASSGAQACPAEVTTLAIDRASAAREIPKSIGYTQGLVFDGGWLFEGTGQEGHSAVFRIDPRTGVTTKLARLDDSQFGEGLAVIGDRFYQLTWQSGLIFTYRYDAANGTLTRVDIVEHDGEAWGLTTIGEELVLSNGSDRLTFLDPETFAEDRTISVRLGDEPVRALNELEFIDGTIFANIYGTTRIVGIDPETGCVTTVVNARQLVADVIPDLKALAHPECGGRCTPWDFVLNGIAYDSEGQDLYLTGKNWPVIFVFEGILD